VEKTFMKIMSAILFLLLLAVSPALSQWKNNGEREGDAPDRKAVKGFGGHLIIVENPREFIQEWLKPETPNIKSASTVKRGEQIGAFVLFAGCKPDAQGICNAEVDYAIYKPGGGLYVERKGQPLWKELAPPVPNIQLSSAILALRMQKNDPAGEYKVKARVRDLNADISFELELKFRLAK
jgi:hypothetical protein